MKAREAEEGAQQQQQQGEKESLIWVLGYRAERPDRLFG
jgi:hypothetical protein